MEIQGTGEEATFSDDDLTALLKLARRGIKELAAIQRSRSGARTVAFACPIKYIHTVAEMAHRDDLESYPALLTAWLQTDRKKLRLNLSTLTMPLR